MNIKNNFKKRIITLISILVLLETLYLFVLPQAVNFFLTKNIKKIEKVYEEKTNHKLSLTGLNLKTHFNLSFTASADKITIKTNSAKEKNTIIDADKISIKIKILPLLIKKVEINNFVVSKILLNVTRNKEGHFNLEDLLLKSDKRTIKIDFKKTKCIIKGYEINFNDLLVTRKTTLKGTSFKINNFTLRKLIDLEMEGSILTNTNTAKYKVSIHSKLPIIKHMNDSDMSINVHISNLSLQDLSPYFSKHLSSKIKQTSGIINSDFKTEKANKNSNRIIGNINANNIEILQAKHEDSITIPGKTSISISLTTSQKKLKLDKFNINNDKFRISANGYLKDYKNKNFYIDTTAKIEQARLEDLAEMLPSNLIPGREEIRKVKKYGLYGDAKAQVKIKGSMPEPNITGSVIGQNVHVLKGLEKEHVAKIKLSFEKRKLITDVLISLPNNQKATVKGLTYMYRDAQNHFDIRSTGALPLKLTQKILLPIQDVFQFQLGPVPQMNITGGTGSVELGITGTKDDGVVKGFVKFKDARTTYQGIFGELYNGDGRVDFLGQKITFETTRAYIKNSPIKLFGFAIINKTVDFNIQSAKANAKDILEIVNKSYLLSEVKEGIAVLKAISGFADIKLNIKAKINPNADIVSNPKEAMKDMKVNGSLGIKNGNCILEGYKTPITAISGTVFFTETKVKFPSLQGKIGDSTVNFFGNITSNLLTKIPHVNIFVKGDKIKAADSIKYMLNSDYSKPISKDIQAILYKISAEHTLLLHYNSISKDIDLDKVALSINFIPQNTTKSIRINEGNIELKNSELKIKQTSGKILGTTFNINGSIKSVFAHKPIFNINAVVNNLDLRNLNYISTSDALPAALKNILSQYKNYSGNVTTNIKISPLSTIGTFDLSNVKFTHTKSNTPIIINDASLQIDTNKLTAKRMTASIGNSPLYAEFTISNLLKKPYIEGYLTTKITEDFLDTYINSKMTYPIKVKGDVSLTANFSGGLDKLNIEPTIKLSEKSDISYLSTNLGDEDGVREIASSILYSQNEINIKKLEYIKYQTSQNNRTYPMLFATIKGSLIKHNNTYEPDNLYIKTQNNLPTRFLNFLFKKSILKDGTFNCSLLYKSNPTTKIPKLFGTLNIQNASMPLYETQLKEINIDTTRDTINILISGMSYNSDFSIDAKMSNKVVAPLVINDVKIKSKQFDLDSIEKSSGKINIETHKNKSKSQTGIEAPNIIIRTGIIEADNLLYRSLPARDFNAKFSLNQKSLLTVRDIDFKVAGGSLKGDGEYNLGTGNMETTLVAKDADSNLLAEAFFDMKNQIYGKMNGQLYFHTKGFTQEERLKNLSGLAYFNLENGRMPKLGSLEYLLRAGNLVKSGVTGLTINSIIELVNPIKTGSFSKINGSFNVENGVAKNIEVFSKGENLSIYVKGTYDLVNSNADMKVLGKLSKKIPTILGSLGNTSLNSLLNAIPGTPLTESDKLKFLKDLSKIPGLDFSNDDYRVFQAKIDGNINGTSYVSSFKWVE